MSVYFTKNEFSEVLKKELEMRMNGTCVESVFLELCPKNNNFIASFVPSPFQMSLYKRLSRLGLVDFLDEYQALREGEQSKYRIGIDPKRLLRLSFSDYEIQEEGVRFFNTSNAGLLDFCFENEMRILAGNYMHAAIKLKNLLGETFKTSMTFLCEDI